MNQGFLQKNPLKPPLNPPLLSLNSSRHHHLATYTEAVGPRYNAAMASVSKSGSKVAGNHLKSCQYDESAPSPRKIARELYLLAIR